MLTLQTFLHIWHVFRMLSRRLFVHGVWRSFAIYDHPRLLSQRQVRYDQIILRFSPFESVHKQAEKFALNIELNCTPSNHLCTLVTPDNHWQVPSFTPVHYPPPTHITQNIESDVTMFPVFFWKHFVCNAEGTSESGNSIFWEMTLAFHVQRRIVSYTFGLCGMYKFMLSCNSPGVGRLDPHIMTWYGGHHNTEKRGMRATTTRNVSECAEVKCSDKIQKGVRRGSDGTSSLPVFRTSSQRGLFKYSEKVSSESHVTQERWGRSHLWKQRCGNIRIHSHHIHFTQRVQPAGVTQYDFVHKRQVAEGWEQP